MTERRDILMILLALVAGLVGGVVSSQFLVGQPAFAKKENNPLKVIEAQEFRVLGEDGKVYARLSSKWPGENHPWPHLAILDAEGDTRILLKLSYPSQFPKKPWLMLQMYGVGGHNLELTELPGQGGRLTFYSNETKEKIKICADDSGPYLELYDKNGNFRCTLGATELKQTRTGVVEKRPPSSLVLFDERGNVIWQAP